MSDTNSESTAEAQPETTPESVTATVADPPAAAAPASAKAKSPLATSAMVVGIVAMVCAVIPGLSFVAFLPAIAAAVLGVVALATKKPKRGSALTGVILGPIALLAAIIVSVAAISAGVNTVLNEQPRDKPASEPVDKPAQEEPVDAAPEPEPQVVVVPEDIVYTGTGDTVLPVTLPDGVDSAAVATVSHVGSRNFIMWSLDSGMNQDELMVNTIGNYEGTVLFNNTGNDDVTSLEINADGAWTVTIRSILSLREFGATAATGVGDDVLIYRGDAGAANITHDGSRNFVVWTYGNRSDLVVNEIGAYTGTTRWTAGPSVVVVSADGNWSISVG